MAAELNRKPKENLPRKKVGFFAKHWFATCLATLALFWESGVGLLFQKGYLDATPNWCVFLLLAVPLLGFIVLFLLHPEIRRRYSWAKQHKLLAVTIGLIVVGLAVFVMHWLFLLTHPANSFNFEFYVNGVLVANNSTVKLKDETTVRIGVKNRGKQGLSGMGVRFMPAASADHFGARGWTIRGEGDWIYETNSWKVPVFYFHSDLVLGTDTQIACPPITLAGRIGAVKAQISADAIGIKTEGVYVILARP